MKNNKLENYKPSNRKLRINQIKSYIKPIIFILIVVLLTLLTIIYWEPLCSLFSNLEKFKSYIIDFGIWGPIVLIGLTTLQVLLAPIPGQAAGFASGFIYGALLGTIYSMIGLVIGSTIAFFLGRIFGRPFVELIVKKKTLDKYDKLIESKKGIYVLFMIFLLPALPDDALCFISGLSKIKYRTFIIISAVGRLPGFFILNLVGSGLSNNQTKISIIIFGIGMVISLFAYFFKDKFEELMFKRIKI